MKESTNYFRIGYIREPSTSEISKTEGQRPIRACKSSALFVFINKAFYPAFDRILQAENIKLGRFIRP